MRTFCLEIKYSNLVSFVSDQIQTTNLSFYFDFYSFMDLPKYRETPDTMHTINCTGIQNIVWLKTSELGISWVSPVVKTWNFSLPFQGSGFDPKIWGTKILQVLWCSQKWKQTKNPSE